MSECKKLLTDSHESLYVRWVWGRGPIYIALVVTHWPNFFLFYENLKKNSKCVEKLTVGKWTEKDFGDDPLTHLCNQLNIPA